MGVDQTLPDGVRPFKKDVVNVYELQYDFEVEEVNNYIYSSFVEYLVTVCLDQIAIQCGPWIHRRTSSIRFDITEERIRAYEWAHSGLRTPEELQEMVEEGQNDRPHYKVGHPGHVTSS